VTYSDDYYRLFFNPLEALVNINYLIKMSAIDPDAIGKFTTMADTQLSRLIDLAKSLDTFQQL
jgi:hypothetical protein